jgi:hypothetical protein
VLTNEPAGGELREYRRERDGAGLRFRFRVHGLPDWDEAELTARAADNAFAVVALAQLAAHRRTGDPERKLRKGEIIALLYRYRYPREDAIKLLRFIDWLIRLPPPLELALRQELAELEEQTKMSYVTSWEQFAREEGVEQGRKEGEAHALLRLLETKFGPTPAELSERVRSAPTEQLDVWLMRILTADNIEQVFDPS